MPERTGALRPVQNARYAIIASRWNPRIVDALVGGAVGALGEHGVATESIDIVRVPGAWEIPLAAARIAFAAQHVADGCANGLMRVALDFRIPVLNGVLAVEKHADAEARAGGAHGNKGEDVALAALEMADLMV